ncbi:MAG: hypothetical protein WAW96_17895 [Alphaproteobacteria bacterium]
MPNTFQLAGLMLFMSLATSASETRTFDRNRLMSEGEVYAVALHDNYITEAKAPRVDPDVARFFKMRAKEIENGAEIAPAKPSAFPIADQSMAARLEWAFEETSDTVESEAADVEPYLTANVEIAYEHWLIAMHDDPKAAGAESLAQSFDARLDDLTASPKVSALEASREHRVASRL